MKFLIIVLTIGFSTDVYSQKDTISVSDKFDLIYDLNDEGFVQLSLIKDIQEVALIRDTISNSNVEVKTFGNRGIEGIDNIIFLDYISEACGVDGGGIYYFLNGEVLTKAFELLSLSDGGEYWITEELIFPDDEESWINDIIYVKDQGQQQDVDFYWVKSSKEERVMEWNGTNLVFKE